MVVCANAISQPKQQARAGRKACTCTKQRCSLATGAYTGEGGAADHKPGHGSRPLRQKHQNIQRLPLQALTATMGLSVATDKQVQK